MFLQSILYLILCIVEIFLIKLQQGVGNSSGLPANIGLWCPLVVVIRHHTPYKQQGCFILTYDVVSIHPVGAKLFKEKSYMAENKII